VTTVYVKRSDAILSIYSWFSLLHVREDMKTKSTTTPFLIGAANKNDLMQAIFLFSLGNPDLQPVG
jgi:hypothetical protein